MQRHTWYCVAAPLLLAIAWPDAWSASSPAPAPTPAMAADASGASKTRPDPEQLDPYLVVQDSWVYLVDEPGIYLDRAREELSRKQPQKASANVRKAAAMVEAEARRAFGEDEVRLERDATALMRVANEIDAGKLSDPQRLDRAFVAARADLGLHHDLKAAEAWLKRDTQAAGRSIAAAARYARSALHGIDKTTAVRFDEGLQSVEQLGSRLGNRTEGAVESDWTRARNTLGHALEALGRQVATP